MADEGLTIVVDNAGQLLADEPPAQLATLLAVLDHVAQGDPATLCVILRTGGGDEEQVRARVAAALAAAD